MLLCLACGVSRASEIPTNAPTILVLGDSLSAGYGIAREQSWPALLEQRLKTLPAGAPYQVRNLSISGETSAGGLSRLGPALQQQPAAIVILALGANDGLRGLPAAQLRANLASMLKLCAAHKARVLLVSMKLPPNYGPDYARQFEQVYVDLARQHRLAAPPFLLDGLAEQRDAFQADGLHPTAAAQPRLLDNVWRGLQPLLKPASQAPLRKH